MHCLNRCEPFSEYFACAGHGDESFELVLVDKSSDGSRLMSGERRENKITLLIGISARRIDDGGAFI